MPDRNSSIESAPNDSSIWSTSQSASDGEGAKSLLATTVPMIIAAKPAIAIIIPLPIEDNPTSGPLDDLLDCVLCEIFVTLVVGDGVGEGGIVRSCSKWLAEGILVGAWLNDGDLDTVGSTVGIGEIVGIKEMDGREVW